MTRIALLGLGAMGRRMAKRLLAAGHPLTVWSRSGVPTEYAELHEYARATPREAVATAGLVISIVTDDEASRQVWLAEKEGALAGLRPGALAIESSTVSPTWVATLEAHVKERGVHFLDAPVVGSRPQAEAGLLVYLVGGAAEDVERAKPLFSTLGGATHHLGPTPNGTLAKLAVNTLFGAQVALLGELLGHVAQRGLDPAKLLEVMATLPVLSSAAKVAGSAMNAGQFAPMFPIALVAKDLRYAVTSATELGASMPLTEQTRAIFDQAVAQGLGAENITAVAKLYRPLV